MSSLLRRAVWVLGSAESRLDLLRRSAACYAVGASLRAAGLVLAVTALGCGGRYGGASVEHPGGQRGIEAAALPYSIVDARTGKSVDEAAFWTKLTDAQAVCVGEEHPNPHHHWLQLHVVRELVKRLPKGTKLALAMEMFQRPFQGVLDDYAAHRIDAAALRSRSGYEDRWGYDFGFYRPTIDAAVGAGGQLLAANAPKELTKKVAHHGLESLTADEKARMPELKLDDAAHRSWFDALMEDLGGSSAHGRGEASESESGGDPEDSAKPDAAKPDAAKSDAAKPDAAAKADAADKAEKAAGHAGDADPTDMPSADRVYTVQVIWDETMADTAARWLAANPGGHVVMLAGNGHCHDTAIINRMKRRGVTTALSVRGVIDDSEGAVGDALAKPINDYVVVLQLPEAKDGSDGKDGKKE